jgi:hypothetical protein
MDRAPGPRSTHSQIHGRMARGGHGLPKASLGLAMLYPSMPCGWGTPELALQPFQGYRWGPTLLCPAGGHP